MRSQHDNVWCGKIEVGSIYISVKQKSKCQEENVMLDFKEQRLKGEKNVQKKISTINTGPRDRGTNSA